MYEGNPRHMWPGDAETSTTELGVGRLIDPDDPAFLEITQAVFELTARLGLENPREADHDLIKMALRLGRAQYKRMREGAAPPRGSSSRESLDGVIYYIRRGSMVKIGTTTDLYKRMAALLPEEVLAVEPGSHKREGELHRQFRLLRVPGQREWFYAGRQLQDHIEEVLDRHGPPPYDLPVLPSAGGILDA